MGNYEPEDGKLLAVYQFLKAFYIFYSYFILKEA